MGGLLLVSFSLGLSNFAAAIGIGLAGIDARARLRVALAFGLFEALMPIVGVLLGAGLAGRMGLIGHYVGAGLLILTGLYVIWWARRKPSGEGRDGADMLKTPQLLLTAPH